MLILRYGREEGEGGRRKDDGQGAAPGGYCAGVTSLLNKRMWGSGLHGTLEGVQGREERRGGKEEKRG